MLTLMTVVQYTLMKLKGSIWIILEHIYRLTKSRSSDRYSLNQQCWFIRLHHVYKLWRLFDQLAIVEMQIISIFAVV